MCAAGQMAQLAASVGQNFAATTLPAASVWPSSVVMTAKKSPVPMDAYTTWGLEAGGRILSGGSLEGQ